MILFGPAKRNLRGKSRLLERLLQRVVGSDERGTKFARGGFWIEQEQKNICLENGEALGSSAQTVGCVPLRHVSDKTSCYKGILTLPASQLRKSTFLFSCGGKAPSGESETTRQPPAQPGWFFRHEIIKRFPTHILIKNSAMQIAR